MKKGTKTALFSLLPLSFLCQSCGSSSDLASYIGKATATGGLSLSYVNPRSSTPNTLIPLAALSTFPDPAGNDFSGEAIGRFNQNEQCDGATTTYNFVLKNNSTTPINSNGPAITFTENTNYNHSPIPSDYHYDITTAPSFPLAAGASTTFTLTVTNSFSTLCHFGEYPAYPSPWPAATIQSFSMTIHTDDSSNPDYSVDLTILGVC